MYIEAVWLLNFCFDTLLVIWMLLLLKRDIKWWRILLAGLIGSITVWLVITPYTFLLDSAIFKISISCIMVLISTRFINIKSYFINLGTFYVVSFVAGGFLYALENMFGGFSYTQSQVSWIFVVLGFPLTFFIIKFFTSTIKVVRVTEQQLVKVSFTINGINFTLDGFIDSGNSLVDPISRTPVIVVSSVCKNELPKVIQELVQTGWKSDICLPDEWQKRLKIIPYKVVGNDSNYMFAFKPDIFVVNDEKKKCLVSFANQILSPDGRFNAIVHPELIN